MEVGLEESVTYSQIPRLFKNFQFNRLLQLKTEDGEKIRRATQFLRQFLQLEEFYVNTNGCLDNTLEFILTNAHFLIKKVDCGIILYCIMELFADLFRGLQEMVAQNENISPIDCLRILDLLGKLIESHHESRIKLLGAYIIVAVLEMKFINQTILKQFSSIVLQVIDLYTNEERACELAHLFTAILEFPMINFLFVRIKQWIQEDASRYLIQDNCVDTILAIHKLLLVYYKNWAIISDQTEDSTTVNNFKTLLPQVCSGMQESNVRIIAEQLLEIILFNLHYKKFNEPDNRTKIAKEIQILPFKLEQWPFMDTHVFFVIVYLQIIYNRQSAWDHIVILQAMNRLLTPIRVLDHSILKCLFDLYPILVEDNQVHYNINPGKTLIYIISTHRGFPKLLTYNKAQMKWLLKSSNDLFKACLLVAWLKFEGNDGTIIQVLEECEMGHVLVEFLEDHPNLPIANRVSQLIVLLKKDVRLNAVILRATLFLSNRPNIIRYLIQTQPDISRECEILHMIQAVSVCMTSFTDDTAIQSACLYLQNLIKSVGYQTTALASFCKFSVCMRFLSVKSCDKNDDTAIAALKLLQRIIFTQISNKIRAESTVNIGFYKILQSENTRRLFDGLMLLQMLLRHHHEKLLITFKEQQLLGIYHQVHTLTKNRTASEAFKVLRLLTDMKPELNFSLATPLCLQLVCSRGLQPNHYGPFMDFVASWLKFIVRNKYCNVPVSDLRHFLQKYLKNEKQYLIIISQLNEYEKKNCIISFY